MKKIFFSLVILVIIGFLWFQASQLSKTKIRQPEQVASVLAEQKKTILRFAVVADSENDNLQLEKALNQAKGSGVNFVIGLGDFTQLGEIHDLADAKSVFDASGLTYYVTAGDRDLWDSRNKGLDTKANFNAVFGQTSHNIYKEGIQIVILDNSDIYLGLDEASLNLLDQLGNQKSETGDEKLTLVFGHKTPYHPQSEHVMGADSEDVSIQADSLIKTMEEKRVDGFFSGDLHFFAQFQSPKDIVKITTIGAVSEDRNILGPRYAIVTVYNDYSFEVDDVEIR